jgi:hypothetical protein
VTQVLWRIASFAEQLGQGHPGIVPLALLDARTARRRNV